MNGNQTSRNGVPGRPHPPAKPIHAYCAILISILVLIVSGSLISSCSTEAEPLTYGTDVCHFCKMTLMDKKFGAELVTKKGKVYKFDDLKCSIDFYNSGYEPTEAFSRKLVVDYSKPGNLIEVTEAFYLKSSEIRSPMNGQIAAFEMKPSMDSLKKEWKAIYLVWGEVITQFK
jgi:copper chaperone NosL